MRFHGDEGGFTMVESLVAATIIALALNVLLVALSTGIFATSQNSDRVTAAVAARSQLEYVKNLPYSTSYAAASSLLPNVSWQAAVTATGVLTDLQKIEIEILRNGTRVLTLEGMKANR